MMGLSQECGQRKELCSQSRSPLRVRYLGYAFQRADNGKHRSELACNRERLMSERCRALQIALLSNGISQIDQPIGYFSPVAKRSMQLHTFLNQQRSSSEITRHAHRIAQVAKDHGDRPLVVSR